MEVLSQNQIDELLKKLLSDASILPENNGGDAEKNAENEVLFADK